MSSTTFLHQIASATSSGRASVARHYIRKLAATTVAVAFAATTAVSLLAAGTVSAADTVVLKPRHPVYLVEVTFNSIKFPQLLDCDQACFSAADVYGYVYAHTQSGGSYDGLPYRNLGTWGGCSGSSSDWDNDDDPYCEKLVWINPQYSFKAPHMCPSSTWEQCTTGYFKNANTIYLRVKPGDIIYATVALVDYDFWSGNDDVCVASKGVGPFSRTDLDKFQTYSTTLDQPSNGSGSCTVQYTMKVVKYVP